MHFHRQQNNSGAGLGLDSKVCCGYESLLFGKCVRWRARGATDSTCLSGRRLCDERYVIRVQILNAPPDKLYTDLGRELRI